MFLFRTFQLNCMKLKAVEAGAKLNRCKMSAVSCLPRIGALLQGLNDHRRGEAKQFLPVQQGSQMDDSCLFLCSS